MAWYRTGTVAVTNGSTTVTGSGTAWVGPVRAGYGINLPDGKLYEVAAVVSNTQVTLATPYLGSTSSGQSYSIVPTRGPEQDLAAAITAMTNTYGAAFTGAGQGKFPTGVVATPSLRNAADENTGVNFLGSDQMELVTNGIRRLLLNTTSFNFSLPITGTAVTQSAVDVTAGRLMKVGDFGIGLDGGSASAELVANMDTHFKNGFFRFSNTSVGAPASAGSFMHLTRINSPLTSPCIHTQIAVGPNQSVVQMWIRQYSNSAWGPWQAVYNASNILGTVSQSAGVPTGAIIERGSNANGEYVRFADGMQICTRPFDAGSIIANGTGTLGDPYHTNPITLNFPATFIAAPVVGFNFPTQGAGGVGGRIINPAGFSISTSALTTLRFARQTSDNTAANAVGTMTAIGRWF